MDELRNAKVRILEVELNYFRNVDKGLLKFSEYSRILKGDFNNAFTVAPPTNTVD